MCDAISRFLQSAKTHVSKNEKKNIYVKRDVHLALKVQKQLFTCASENICTVAAEISLENLPDEKRLLAEFSLNPNLGIYF